MSHEGVQELTSFDDYTSALAEQGVMVLDCSASWCGPCIAIAPRFVEYAKQYPAARFYKLDIDEVPEVASKLKIRSVPTFLFYKDGQQVDKVGGAVPDEIEAAVVKSLA